MLHVCSTPQEQIERLVAIVSEALTQDIRRRGHAVLAVSGGRSPIALFQALAVAPIAWEHVTVTLADDRLLPADHADSNAALVHTHLLQGAAARARFLPVVDDPNAMAASVERANARFRALGQPLTIAVLGMGDDGHTASLFPGAAEIGDGLDPTYPAPYLGLIPPHAPYPRITLSVAELLRAGRLLLSIAGETKRAVYARASTPPPRADLPISFVMQQQSTPFDAYWAP